jgi:hypothetical protein
VPDAVSDVLRRYERQVSAHYWQAVECAGRHILAQGHDPTWLKYPGDLRTFLGWINPDGYAVYAYPQPVVHITSGSRTWRFPLDVSLPA